MFEKIRKFVQEEIWHMPLHDKSPRETFFIKQLRIFVIASKGFLEDRVSLRASSLTFFTILSIIPLVAMAFGVAKGFGFQKRMEDFIVENLKGQEEVMNWIINLSKEALENVQGGLLAGIGLILLIWSVMQVLTNIENSFNAIWQVRKSRSFFRKLADYLAITLIAPLLIIVSSSVMVYVSTRFQSASESIEVVQVFTPIVNFILKIVPYALIWLVFTLLYIIMPNTRVNFKYALIAGIIAGTLFQVGQWAYIHFQIGVARFSALYGTFAALPLFMIWLRISWLFVLLGAEISFAYQNVDQYEYEAESLQISNQNKKVLSILIMHHIIKNFEQGGKPYTSTNISHDLGIPLRLVRSILDDLVTAGVLTETITELPKEKGFHPAIDINKITGDYVMNRLDDLGSDHVIVKESKAYERINEIYKKTFEDLRTTPMNTPIKDIV